MDKDFYQRLVDLYAGGELTEELQEDLEAKAIADPELARDMLTLRRTVNVLQSMDGIEFTDESYHRVLMKLYARSGTDLELKAPPPAHLQYHLPIQG